jgi:hypothetical protein
MVKIVVYYILLIIIFITPVCKCEDPFWGKEYPGITQSDVDNYNKRLISESSSPPPSQGNGGSSSSARYYYTNTATDTIEVDTHTDYSRIEGELPLYCEVGITKEFKNSLPNKAISGLTICERVDDNVDLVKEPVCYLSYFGNKSSKIMSDLDDNISIDVNNDTSGEFTAIPNDRNTRSFYVPRLGPRGRIIIYYKVMSKNEGTVNLATSVRFNEKDYRDEDHDFKFKSTFPVDVIANPQKSRLFTGWLSSDDLRSTSIIYDIEYQNVSGKVNNKTVNITIEGKSDYYDIKRVAIGDYNLESNNALDKKYDYHRNNTSNQIKFILPFAINNRIIITADYFYEGENTIPYVFLDNVRFPKERVKISVEDYLNSISSVIYLVIINTVALIISCIIAIFTFSSNKKNNQDSKRMFSDHKKEHLSQINASTNSIQKEIGQMNINLKEIALELRKINKKFR